MDKKPNQDNNQNQLNAAGGCGANCNKCKGNCIQQAQHNGPHECNSGHNW